MTKTAPMYRVRERREPWDFMTSAELAGCRFATEQADKPDDPQLPEPIFYCHGEDCPVREVIVSMKLFGTAAPKAYTCPVCRGPLEKIGYRKMTTLEPVEQPA